MPNSLSTPLRVGAAAAGVLALVAVGLVLAYGPGDGRWVQGALGAGPGESASPEPSVSDSPTTADTSEEKPAGTPKPTTPAQIKAKNIADAKARLEEYYATTASVANNGYEKWENRLQNFWGTRATRVAAGQVYDDFREQGVYTKGAAELVSVKASNYTPATAGFEEITLDACLDFSEVQTFDRRDKLIPRDASAPTRYMFTYEMRNQGKSNEWAFIAESPDQERTC
ncbi:hypothetical protein GCM10028784_38750 [Myceligenerans cantabricum]